MRKLKTSKLFFQILAPKQISTIKQFITKLVHYRMILAITLLFLVSGTKIWRQEENIAGSGWCIGEKQKYDKAREWGWCCCCCDSRIWELSDITFNSETWEGKIQIWLHWFYSSVTMCFFWPLFLYFNRYLVLQSLCAY